MDSYFNQLMEIQNSTDHSFFLLDQDSEPRFVIEADKRTIIIPAEFQFLGVKTDQRSEKIYFEVDRIFDDVDLSTKTCVIQYINAGTDDVDEGIYPVTELDTTTVPGKIVFKWEVDNIVCKYAGVVAFSVRFYEIDPETKLYTYCWNTIPESLPVLDGLNVSGSVTEDFPTELLEWNARMAALNTEITNKISAADATMKADLKTAKGYMDGAQAARGGAEEAESRVNKIVAGNEAYTKTESDTAYAKSQIKESERGTSVEIYPEDGSNLAVTVYGFTEQTGSGDPSPDNVRAIKNGGIVLNKTVFNGSENWILNGTGSGQTPYFYLSNAYIGNLGSILYSTRYPKTSITISNSAQGIGGYQTTCYIRDSKYSTVADLKAALQANPLTVWYATTDGTGSLYAPIILSSGEYRATCLPLTAPLCEGDSVVSWVKSGCDKVLVLDGTQSLTWTQNSTAPYGGFFTVGAPNALQSVIGTIAQILSDRLTPIQNVVTSIASGTAFFSSAGGKVNFTLFGQKSVEDANAYLSQNPITIWYRSTNYTEDDDIAVSLETHQQAVLVLDGTENFQLLYGDNTFVWEANKAAKGDQTILCDHYKGTNTGWVSLQNNQIQMVTNGRYIGAKDTRFSAAAEFKAHLAAQYAAGTPATIVYELATPITYAHPGVDIISNINESGSIVVSGQKEISVSYHKSLDKTIVELDNKAYSKQESDNIFAKALRGTSEAAKSISIHPDAGSNVIATINGFTKQDGSGDASPNNVRALTNGGIRYGAIVYDGSSDESYTVNNKAFILSPKPDGISAITSASSKTNLLCDKLQPKSAGETWSGNQGVSQASESNRSVQICVTGITTTSGLKEWLKQNPITVWYPLATGPLYASITGTGDGHTGACAELTAPLCQGDKLITKVKSGCDKKIIITGKENWTGTAISSNAQNTYYTMPISDGIGNASKSGIVLCNIANSNSIGSWNELTEVVDKIGFGIKWVNDNGIKSADDLKTKLSALYNAGTPAIMYYKSTAYTPAADIPVSLETHQQAVLVLDGTEAGLTFEATGNQTEPVLQIPLSAINRAVVPKCSHYNPKNAGFPMPDNTLYYASTYFGNKIAIRDSSWSSLEDAKSYLAAQYAAGTPVTIVYELATPHHIRPRSGGFYRFSRRRWYFSNYR